MEEIGLDHYGNDDSDGSVGGGRVEDQEMPGRDAPLEMQAQGVNMQNERATRSDSARALNHVRLSVSTNR